jgi:hypothetical protein
VSYYVPGLGEKDPDKTIRSLMQVHENTATNTTDIATNAAAIAVLQGAGYVVGPASATDLALARFDLATGKLIQNSEITLGDSDGKLTRAAGISISGTNTNDNAAAGYVGQYISAEVASGSAISLTSPNAADVTSISLTAGDWDVSGNVGYLAAGGTVVTIRRAAIHTVSATIPTAPNGGAFHFWQGSVTGLNAVLPTGTMRLSLSATTTVYLSASSTFTTSTQTAYGFIGARRVR